MLVKILVHEYFAAIVIPILFLLATSFSRKLVRGQPWEQRDFYLGIEFTLSAMAAGLIYIFELARTMASPGPSITVSGQAIGATAGYIAVTFFILLWLVAMHQDWDRPGQDSKKKRFRLAVLCPAIGAILLASFIILVKG